MVSSMKAKTRRSSSLQIDCLIHIQEIKPWPPSQSLRSVRSVMIQWGNGDRHSGSTNVVVPNLDSVAGEGRIEFNESFRLPVTLVRDMVVKGAGGDTFQKNCLQFHLYELRREKTSKGQLLASATIDLADYGVVREALCVNAQMNCKRSFGNMNQPVLYIKIQPIDKGRTCSSTRDSLSRGMSFDSTIGKSVLNLISEEYGEENEVALFTDDDISSHSSMTVFSSNMEIGGVLPPQSEENGHVSITQNLRVSGNERALISGNHESSVLLENGVHENLKAGSSSSSSLDLSSDPESPINDCTSMHGWPHSGSISSLKNSSNNDSVHCSSSSSNGILEDGLRSNDPEHLREEIHDKNVLGRDCLIDDARGLETYNCSIKEKDEEDIQEDTHKLEKKSKITDDEILHRKDGTCRQDLSDGDVLLSGKGNSGIKGNDTHKLEEKSKITDDEILHRKDGTCRQDLSDGDVLLSGKGNSGIKGNDRLQHAKSVRSSTESVWNKGLVRNQMSEVKVHDALEHAQKKTGSLGSNEKKDAKIYPKDTKSSILDSKIQQLHHRIRLLEGELREAAVIEASLYSAVAEHGSSVSKVHAPARRLIRLYLHSCKENSRSQKASAARSAVSGLVLVAKACGNDVPRLTFWLSNSCALRTVIQQINGDVNRKYSVGSEIERNGCSKGINNISQVKSKTAPSEKRGEFNSMHDESFGDWGEPQTFILALEKFEAWIFSRIIESIWWQTLTPRMQSSAAKSVGRISSPGSGKSRKRILSIDQEQRTLSLDLWKNAFKDASERICPVRAGGHECGCLPILAKLIMEQCVARLDVAMFNAILRESADEIPTDPVSDPVSDSKVLPIPAGKSSFGAGAQLKNAIGNWSQWLTDSFGLGDDDQTGNENDDGDRQDTCFKAFHLLNALSGLMMLPKDMLLDRTIRREVCPTFGSLLMKRVLDNFVPDEFCTDPIPDAVLESLNFEDSTEAGEQLISNFPCTAAPIVYSPPLAASLAGIAGEIGQSELRRSGSSLLRKSYTSDDELDELNSGLDSILMDSPRTSPASTKPSWISKEKNQNVIRYELLREIWMNSD